MAETSPNPQDEPTPDPSAQNSPTEAGVDDAAEEALRAAGRTAEEISAEALEAVRSGSDPSHSGGGDVLNLPEFSNGSANGSSPSELSLLDDVNLNVAVELGRTRMYVEDVLKLNANSVVELEKAAGDPVDIFVNDRLIARGEVLVLNENFCVRISEIVKQSARDD